MPGTSPKAVASAYRSAGYAPTSDNATDANASRLLRDRARVRLGGEKSSALIEIDERVYGEYGHDSCGRAKIRCCSPGSCGSQPPASKDAETERRRPLDIGAKASCCARTVKVAGRRFYSAPVRHDIMAYWP